jgi:hypothetical protein
MSQGFYEDFSETLTPEQYERYLVFRKQRDGGEVKSAGHYGFKDWVGVDPVPLFDKNTIMRVLKNVREVDKRLREPKTTGVSIMVESKVETYTTEQVLEKLDVSLSTLCRWVHEGKIPKEVIAGRGLYKKSVFDELHASGALSKVVRGWGKYGAGRQRKGRVAGVPSKVADEGSYSGFSSFCGRVLAKS